MFGKEYCFVLEIWENKDKLLGTRKIDVKEFSESGAIKKSMDRSEYKFDNQLSI